MTRNFTTLRTGFIATALFAGLVVPGWADIDSATSTLRCGATPRIDPGRSASVTIRGEWTDYAKTVTCTTGGCGITGSVVRKGGGFSKQGPFAELRLTARSNETPGLKTIRVTMPKPLGGTETDTFRVTVPSRLVTRVNAPTPSNFFTRFSLAVEGNDLPESVDNGGLAVVAVNSPTGGSLLQGGAPGGSVQSFQWTRNSRSRGTIAVQMADPMRRAVLQVNLRPRAACYINGSGDRRVFVDTTARDTLNYVDTIRPDAGQSARPGDTVSFTVALQRPVGQPAGGAGATSRFPKQVTRIRTPAEKVFWRLLPSDVGRPAAPVPTERGLNVLSIPNGRQSGRISIELLRCPQGAVGSAQVTLETFMHDRSAASAPARRQVRFRMSCPER